MDAQAHTSCTVQALYLWRHAWLDHVAGARAYRNDHLVVLLAPVCAGGLELLQDG